MVYQVQGHGRQGQGRSRFMGTWEGVVVGSERSDQGASAAPLLQPALHLQRWKNSPRARRSASKKSTLPSRPFASVSCWTWDCNCNGRSTTQLPASHLCHLATPFLDSRLESSAAAKSTQPRARVQWLCDASKHQLRAAIPPRLRIPCCAYRLPALPVVDARSPVETCRRASRKLPSPSPPPSPLLLALVLLPPLRH